LAAYIWPDQAERRARSAAAVAAATPLVDPGGAAYWVLKRLETPFEGCAHMIFHTVAWQYFPKEEQARAQAAIEAAGARASDRAPLAWFGMEADGGSPGAGMVLRLWPRDERIDLGRVDFHGRWMRWAG